MTLFISIIHGIVCVLLIVIILMQSGRGGGLTEGFASAESMFGAQTNTMLIKATTIFATIFLMTNLVSTFLNIKRSESLMPNKVAVITEEPLTKDLNEALGDASQKVEEKAEELKTEVAPTVDAAKEATPPVVE